MKLSPHVCNGWKTDLAPHSSPVQLFNMRLALIIPSVATISLSVPAMAIALPSCPSPPLIFGTAKVGIAHLRVPLTISIDRDGTVRWSGHRISDATFKRFVAEAGELNPEPQLIVDVTNRPNCQRLQKVRRVLERAPICSKHLCSEGSNWRRWQITGGP